jgi:O-antigen/teichoic acid export membrane protein
VFAREIVAIIAPANYAPAAGIVPLIAFAYGLNGIYVLMVTGMGVAKRTTPMLWVVGGAAIGNVAINIVLIPLWGMRAAAWTTVLANMIMVAGSWYFSQRAYPIEYDWRRIFLTTGIGVAVVSAVVWLTPGHGLVGYGGATVGWLVFVFLLVRSGVITPSNLAAARGAMRLRAIIRRRSTSEWAR